MREADLWHIIFTPLNRLLVVICSKTVAIGPQNSGQVTDDSRRPAAPVENTGFPERDVFFQQGNQPFGCFQTIVEIFVIVETEGFVQQVIGRQGYFRVSAQKGPVARPVLQPLKPEPAEGGIINEPHFSK
mgnify:CR=1 FL=1